MTTEIMHAGLDVILQQLNSNINLGDLRETKDYLLNSTTQDLIKAVLLNEDNAVKRIIGEVDIKKYIEVLQSYINTLELERLESVGNGYDYGIIPKSISLDAISSGLLIDGVTYKVTSVGTIDLSSFGGSASPSANDTFVCNIDSLTGASIDLVVGETYKIINTGGGNFVAVGARANVPGTVFVAIGVGPVVGSVSTEIKPLKSSPIWNGATLIPIRNIGYYNYISVKASVKYGNPITAGYLTKGKKYLIETVGSTDLSTYGAYSTNDENLVFSCTKTGIPSSWVDTVLYEIKDVECRPVRNKDLYRHLSHSFGSSSTSPIMTIANNEVRVHHNNKYKVYGILLEYLVIPIYINYAEGVESDMPESMHDLLVQLTAKKAAGYDGIREYQSIAREIETRDKNSN